MSHVDVMVTCYNYGHFLRECVESVLTQSHKDLRVLIVDDASTDNTPAICAELAAQDQRIEILRHPVNLGHIPTYNECIDLASNDYMLVLSADDFLLPGALERAVAVLASRPDVGLCHGSHVLYRIGDILPDATRAPTDTEFLDAAWFIEKLAVFNYVSTATALVRTCTQKQLGRYRLDLPHSGDMEMWLRFALHSKVAYVHAPQAAYRRHDSNMSLKYQGIPDLRQSVEAFWPHYRAIRRLLPGGMRLKSRIRRMFAAREKAFALVAWQQGWIRASLGLHALSLHDKLAASMLELGATFGFQPQARPQI